MTTTGSSKAKATGNKSIYWRVLWIIICLLAGEFVAGVLSIERSATQPADKAAVEQLRLHGHMVYDLTTGKSTLVKNKE